ncbi:MBL fold metallo-hydrolase [Paenibacillus sp. Soil787]|uniref:MBL fold metallo-hydrolase n=1 Tax=Paenibacillus sp. Soil787 TaxID=1736411 RepID=UPI0039E1911B
MDVPSHRCEKRNASAALIDAGMPGMGASIILEISQAGLPIEWLRSIIETHQDIDHYGSVSELL